LARRVRRPHINEKFCWQGPFELAFKTFKAFRG
jgi:hypothetical protein